MGFDDFGGNGGGIILLGISEIFQLDGIVSSDGTMPTLMSLAKSGAGSGGTIQLFLTYLNGSGLLSASGGNGTAYGGEGNF